MTTWMATGMAAVMPKPDYVHGCKTEAGQRPTGHQAGQGKQTDGRCWATDPAKRRLLTGITNKRAKHEIKKKKQRNRQN